MAKSKKIGKPRVSHRKKFRTKYRLKVFDEKTFAEVFSFRLSIHNVCVVIATMLLIMVVLVYVLIAYTPLKEYIIPEYPEIEERDQIESNVLLVDSLEYQMKLYEQKWAILVSILNGEDPAIVQTDSVVDTPSENYANLDFGISPADSLMRLEIQENEALNVNFHTNSAGVRLENFFFYPPINGVVSSSFTNGHWGTDVVAPENSIIHSVLDGTVIFDTWTVETGYTIAIQHANNFISIYKHNSKLLKKAGDRVVAGEGIALLGNTGSLTMGPHLHFELWHDGSPVNSETYIVY